MSIQITAEQRVLRVPRYDRGYRAVARAARVPFPRDLAEKGTSLSPLHRYRWQEESLTTVENAFFLSFF